MDSLVSGYRSMAHAGVELYSTVAPDVPEQVFVDPLRIRQILANGVTNALKYTPAGEVQLHVMAGFLSLLESLSPLQ